MLPTLRRGRARHMNRQEKLTVIANELQYWLDTNDAQQLEAIGKDRCEDDTHVISPPSWPTRGVLKEWIKAMRQEETPKT